MSEVKGEARQLTYKPGETVPESLPVEDGVYTLSLKNKGKEGLKGWCGIWYNIIIGKQGSQPDFGTLPLLSASVS